MKRALSSTLIVTLFCIAVVSSHATLRAESLFGITDTDQLLVIDSQTGMVTSATSLSGLGPDESLIGIDIRPATGELYGYSSGDRFYKINPGTGATAAIGAALGLIDSIQAFDFDPLTDQIRLVTNFRKNIRVNPNTGGVISNDGMLTFAGGDPNTGISPVVVHAAYTNSYSGAGNTTLYNLEAGQNVLTIQTPENNGTLSTVGSVGVNLGILSAVNGMDISGATGTAYVVGNSIFGDGLTENTLYTIDLSTGEIVMSGPIQDLGVAPRTLTDGGHGSGGQGGSWLGDGWLGDDWLGGDWISGGGQGGDEYCGDWNCGDWNDCGGNDFGMIVDVAAPVGVPEPSTFIMAACGAVGLLVLARRRVVRKN